jgi:hypothetical protein
MNQATTILTCSATLQDDAYLIAADGWVARPARIVEVDKKGKARDKGWACDLIPKALIVARYFAAEQAAIEASQAELEAAIARLGELEEEHGGENAAFSGFDSITAAAVKDRLREIGTDPDGAEERAVLKQWQALSEQVATLKKTIRAAEAALDQLAFEQYPRLDKADIQSLVVDDKWMAHLSAVVQGELDRVSQTLTGRIRELAERYASPLPQLTDEVAALAARVEEHLARMGAETRHLKQAAMQQLLTGQTRLPGFSGEWEERRLGEIGQFLKGAGVKKDEANSGDLPCVRYGELYTHHNDVIRRFNSWISSEVARRAVKLKKGDLLFAGSGETKEEIGKCAAFVSDCEAYAGGDIVILRSVGVDPIFMGYYCNTKFISSQKASMGQGDAVVHISATALSGISVLIPGLAEQAAIAAVLSDMDAELAALEARLEKTRLLKQGMMQELLTGRTRLA